MSFISIFLSVFHCDFNHIHSSYLWFPYMNKFRNRSNLCSSRHHQLDAVMAMGTNLSVPTFEETGFKVFPPHLHLTTSKVMVIVWRLRGNIIRTVLYIAIVLPLQWVQLTKTVHTARLGLEFVFSCLSGWMIYLYVGVCFVLPWTVESLPFMLWRWRNKLKWAPFELFAPSSLLWFRSWLHPFKGHCEQKAMRDEGFIYVADHQLYWTGDVQDSQGVSVSLNANYKYF